ncbi:glycosyltransferase family 2 protein [Bacteroides fluxus]|uniref:Glycosyltransferase, group 2 family protein n=1 Tax=Bacteroides fluxus YIT 12057 TaxID=763034 RepID=F3PUQ2_9BACE|nr:glycosyltransferase family 2 protein [Bacteroides fluxus]EGF55995.1 glycosyltransferase, group 2 family protein [Bacteroides fluxus YIT 12057]
MEDCKLLGGMDIYTYSIIIPHKNSPNLLRRCLDSIPHRDDVQIIVVDDNSDLSKVDFSCFPGIGENNTEVFFTKEGKGAGYARNVGLKHAKGKWLLFADADDYFTEGFIFHLDKYKESAYDIVFFGTTSVYTETEMVAMRHLFDKKCMNAAISENNFRLYRYIRTSPVSKIIRRSLVENKLIFFDEVIAANDALFSIKTGYYAKSVAADPFVMYVITVQSGSLEYTYSKRVLLCRIMVDMNINRFYKEHNVKEHVCALRYIIQLRKISFILYLRYVLKYFLLHPINGIYDFLYLFRCKIKSARTNSRDEIRKNNTYIKVEKI